MNGAAAFGEALPTILIGFVIPMLAIFEGLVLGMLLGCRARRRQERPALSKPRGGSNVEGGEA